MLDDDAKPAMRHLLAIRLVIGLTQGLALYALWRWQGQLVPWAYGALLVAVSLVPTVALATVGAAGRRTTVAWLLAATLITLLIGGYQSFVYAAGTAWSSGPPNTGVAAVFTAAALFILHHLILPAEAEGRWRASYARYFDEGWKNAVRLGLAVGFVGALWILLFLGSALFKLIGLDFLEKLIARQWFSFPATTVFFAISVHITDIRVGLVRGARTLALSLLSWLLPVLTLIAVGFLAALPFTGLKPLLATRTSSGIMLASCAALIILINATYQDGERDGFPPVVLKWVTRIAAVALAPLALVAAYGVSLRIGQHGLSPERIYASACVLIAVCYAGGYLWAAVSRGAWSLETTNWITAQVAVALLLALFSPLLDPARISVGSQVHRLESGRTTARAFDYGFLRFSSGRWGDAALKRLAASRNPEVARLARSEQDRARPWEKPALRPSERLARLQTVGDPLPGSFITQVWTADNDPARDCWPDPTAELQSPGVCEAVVTEFDDAPGPDVIVFGPESARVFSLRNGLWVRIGQLANAACPGDVAAVRAGRLHIATVTAKVAEIDGRRVPFAPDTKCPEVTKATAMGARPRRP